MLQITPSAAKRLERPAQRAGRNGPVVLRLVGVLGTCAGAAPRFEAASAPEPEDAPADAGGFRIWIAPECQSFADGATLDCRGGFWGRGLVIRRPHRPGCDCTCATM